MLSLVLLFLMALLGLAVVADRDAGVGLAALPPEPRISEPSPPRPAGCFLTVLQHAVVSNADELFWQGAPSVVYQSEFPCPRRGS